MLRLREIREAQDPKLTQEALAYRAGVSVRTVGRAERLGTASVGTLRTLATALGVDLEDLFSPDPEQVA